MRWLLPTLVALGALAVACSDGGPKTINGLLVIERLDVQAGEHEVGYQDRIVPPLESPYPDAVATVNGEEITGQMLVVKQVELAAGMAGYAAIAEQSGMPEEYLPTVEAAFEEADALELLIEDMLLKQAADRLGYAINDTEALEIARDAEAATDYARANVSEDLLVAIERERVRLGYPEAYSNLDPLRVQEIRLNRGVANLKAAECDSDPTRGIESFDPTRSGPDCSDFLARERANADIQYFVIWAR